MEFALGLAAALVASFLYDWAVALQALDVRIVSLDHSLRVSLLGKLLRSPRWVGATLMSALGHPFQVVALMLIPLTVVQPALAVGLLLLLYLGVRVLKEPIGKREVLSTAAIVLGVAGIAAVAPRHTSTHESHLALVIVLGTLALAAVAPYFLRRHKQGASMLVVLGAGAAFAWGGFSSKIIADEILVGDWILVVAWAVPTALTALVGLLSEMTAMQHRPATQVAPIVFVVQMVVPVIFAPILGGENWLSTPLWGIPLFALVALVAVGSAVLAQSPPVAAIIESSAKREQQVLEKRHLLRSDTPA